MLYSFNKRHHYPIKRCKLSSHEALKAGAVHVVMGGATLRAMGLVDDDREFLVAQVGNALDDKREFLDGGGDDDFLATFQRRAQLACALHRRNNVFHLGKILIELGLFATNAQIFCLNLDISSRYNRQIRQIASEGMRVRAALIPVFPVV